jgi:hypothetical protein
MSVVPKRVVTARDMHRIEHEADEWFTRLKAARGRIGRTPLERLRWLLNFCAITRSELIVRDPSELVDLGAEVCSFAELAGMNMNRDASKAISVEDLADLTEAVRQGMALLHGPTLDPAGWHFEPSRFGSLNVAIQARTFRRYYFGDWRPVFLMGVLDLLTHEGRRITNCARSECSRLFVRRKRGSYCSGACSQKERTATRRRKVGEKEWSEMRHEQYRRHVAKEKGKSVATKVQRRSRKELE